MRTSIGTKQNALVECINPRRSTYRVRWNVQQVPAKEGETADDNAVSFVEEEFARKPTIEEVKATILAWFNKEIDEKILSGFTWNGYPVWLSSENQFNYKTAYDLAVQTSGASLPVTVKFGTTDAPQYHTFETVDEFTEFFTSAMAYIQQTLTDGWAKKDAVDFTEYEGLLNT